MVLKIVVVICYKESILLYAYTMTFNQIFNIILIVILILYTLTAHKYFPCTYRSIYVRWFITHYYTNEPVKTPHRWTLKLKLYQCLYTHTYILSTYVTSLTLQMHWTILPENKIKNYQQFCCWYVLRLKLLPLGSHNSSAFYEYTLRFIVVRNGLYMRM